MSFLVSEQRAVGDAGQPLVPQRLASGTGSVATVSADAALTLSAVWRAVSLRADLISTTPINVYRQVAGTKVDMPMPAVLTNPGGAQVDICEWLYSSQVSLDLRGNAYGVIVARDGLGYPTQIELQDPDQVSVTRDKTTKLPVYRVGGKVQNTFDMWHEKAFTMPGMLVGLSPLAYMARTMGIGLGASDFGAQWFRDSLNPSGLLTTEQRLTPDEAKSLSAMVTEAWSGNRGPAVLGAGASWQPLSVKPEESQFLLTIGANGADVARFFSMQPEMIGFKSGDSLTYANLEQRGLDFRTFGIGPAFIRRERALSRLLPAPRYARYDLDSLNRADLLTRWKAHVVSIAGRVKAPSEVRDDEDLPPMTAEQLTEISWVPQLTITPLGGAKALPPAPAEDPDPDEDPDEPDNQPSTSGKG